MVQIRPRRIKHKKEPTAVWSSVIIAPLHCQGGCQLSRAYGLWSAAFMIGAVATFPTQVEGAGKSDSQAAAEVRTAVELLTVAEPRVRYCEGGKEKGAADLAISAARDLVESHQELREFFEIRLRNNRKIEIGILGLDYLGNMDCGPWADNLVEALNKMFFAMAAYERLRRRE